MIHNLSEHYKAIIEGLGENPNRNGLLDTPTRAAKAMAHLTGGYKKNLAEVVNGAVFESDNDEMVVVRDIEFYSLCEHHLLPFYGKVHIGYLPNGRVLGLSKFARITDMFARRLQIQENMTLQIAEAIAEATYARGVAVVVEASHMCMMMRGVEKQGAMTTTSVMHGDFRNSTRPREEFLRYIAR